MPETITQRLERQLIEIVENESLDPDTRLAASQQLIDIKGPRQPRKRTRKPSSLASSNVLGSR